MNPSDPLDLWLDSVDFEPIEIGSDATTVDDPWANALLDPPGLSDAQRAFIDDTSPAFGAAVTSTNLSGQTPFSELDDAAVEAADSEIIDFDDES